MTSKSQVPEFKYCTFYGKKHGTTVNPTTVFRLVCYSNEICCEREPGCCSPRTNKYYESWLFWLFVFGIMISLYVMCWYCKKLEKERQLVRMNASNQRNPPPRILPCLRSVETNSVDHLLENLILNYRNRLMNQNRDVTQNIDALKVVDNNKGESPPEYKDALKMPKPCNNVDEHSYVGSRHSIVDIIDDQTVPSYEDAIKNV